MATTLSIIASNAAQLEGDSGSKAFVFTVNRTGDLGGASSVQWRVAGVGTNPANAADFLNGALPSGTVAFAVGESSKVISVHVNGDTTVENDERFNVILYSPIGATIGTSTAIGTILSDDLPSISLSLSQASVAEDGSNNLVYIFSRTGPTSSPLTINYIVRGNADYSDYIGVPAGNIKSITFAAGASSATLVVDPTSDTLVETDETVEVSLSPTTFYTISTPAAVVGTIINDDTSLAITPATISQQEGNSGVTQYTFTVTRIGLLSGSSTAQWSVVGIGGQPADAADFPGGVLPTGSVTFAAGETSKTIIIDVNGDTIAENDETFAVTLADPTGATITTATASGTIVNDDTNLGIIAINADQVEGNSGSKSFTFAIERTGVLSGTSTTSWAAAGSGITPANASDFAGGTLPSGTVTFAPGEASKLISIDINGDTQIETDETFSVTLYDSSELTPLNPTATGTIISDEPITISLSVQPSNALEDSGNPLTYTFTRNGPTDTLFTINFLVSGSADPSTDYTTNCDLSNFPLGIITFNAGDSVATLEITPIADSTFETDETIEIELLASSDYAVGTVGPVVATIINDDVSAAILAITATDATKTEGNGGSTSYTFTVNRNGDKSGVSSVIWSVGGSGDHPATANDFANWIYNSDTTHYYKLLSSGGNWLQQEAAAIAEGGHLVSINSQAENDWITDTFGRDFSGILWIGLTDQEVEGQWQWSSGEPVNFTNWKVGEPNNMWTWINPRGEDYAQLIPTYGGQWNDLGPGSFGGGDTWGSDFIPSIIEVTNLPAGATANYPGYPSSSITFAAGETTKTITIQVNGDNSNESDEGFNVTLSDPTGASISIATAYGNIQNDDPVPCLAPGTLIRTPSGNRPVEELQIGDLVLTPDGPQPLKFLGISSRHVNNIRATGKMPVRITAGVFGENLPSTDIYCTPSHAFALGDCLVEAQALINGQSIYQLEELSEFDQRRQIEPQSPLAEQKEADSFTYYSLEFEQHALVWANDLLTESYLPTYRDGELTRVAWNNYDNYLSLYGSSETMDELPMPRIPFSRQIPLRIREQFGLDSIYGPSTSGANREELCLTL